MKFGLKGWCILIWGVVVIESIVSIWRAEEFYIELGGVLAANIMPATIGLWLGYLFWNGIKNRNKKKSPQITE